MQAKRIKLDISQNLAEREHIVMHVNEIRQIVASVQVEGVAGGEISFTADPRYVALLSPRNIRLEGGTYVRDCQWSVKANKQTQDTPVGWVLAEIRAVANGLVQLAQFWIVVV